MIRNCTYKHCSFNGNYHCNITLKNKLNNIKELNALVNNQNFDTATIVSENSKYLPNHDIYNTIAYKIMNDKIFLGTDCILLSKKADNETTSKNILQSVQKAISILVKKIETNSADKITSSPTYVQFCHLK